MRLLGFIGKVDRLLHRVRLPPAQARYQPNTNGPDHHSHHPTPLPPFQYRPGLSLSPNLLSPPPTVNPHPKRHYYNQRGHPVIEPPSFEDIKKPASSPASGRAFTYTMVGASGVLGAMAAKSTVLDFLTSLSAAGTVLALAQVEVDLSTVPEGKNVVVKWRGKPIFIRHRTGGEIEEAERVPLQELRDPQRDAERVQRPEWLVMLGICTHLGCVPLGESGDYGGCGSHYDISGRVRKGPAPTNLEIPKYSFVEDHKIVIG